jgi:hypothetical protein
LDEEASGHNRTKSDIAARTLDTVIQRYDVLEKELRDKLLIKEYNN